jgi:hypothetical protein
MINGRIFDAATMAQTGNHPAPAPRATWKEGQITASQVSTDIHGIPIPPTER